MDAVRSHFVTMMSLILLLGALTTRAQQCNAQDFVVTNGQEVILKISSTKEVHACEVNICDQLTAALQSLSLSADKKAISISNGNTITLPDDSATNELQTLSLNNGIVSLSNDGGSFILPDGSSTNEMQSIALSNTGTLSISGGNSVELPDASASNELQSLSVNGNMLSITSGNSVQLPSVWSLIQNITYTAPVSITSTTWAPVKKYDLPIVLPSNFSLLQIALQIPYSGNTATTKRGRAQLWFDSTVLYDYSAYGNSPYELSPVQMYGLVPNVAAGSHFLQVKAFSESGNTLLLPAYDPASGEGVAPAIFGSYNIIGFP